MQGHETEVVHHQARREGDGLPYRVVGFLLVGPGWWWSSQHTLEKGGVVHRGGGMHQVPALRVRGAQKRPGAAPEEGESPRRGPVEVGGRVRVVQLRKEVRGLEGIRAEVAEVRVRPRPHALVRLSNRPTDRPCRRRLRVP